MAKGPDRKISGKDHGKSSMSAPMVRIRGVVIPADWDAEGNVIATAISAWDEVEYRIEKVGGSASLLEHMHQEIEVAGELNEGKKVRTIKVHEFKVKRRNRANSK